MPRTVELLRGRESANSPSIGAVLTCVPAVLVPLGMGIGIGTSTTGSSAVPVNLAVSEVFLHNVGVAILAFVVGVMTYGVGSLVVAAPGWLVAGIQIGASFRVAGLAETLGRAGHWPVEILAFSVIYAASFSANPLWADRSRHSVSSACKRMVTGLTAGLALLILAALVEVLGAR